MTLIISIRKGNYNRPNIQGATTLEICDTVGERNLDEAAKAVTRELLEDAIKQTEKVEDVTVRNFDVNWAGKLGDNLATFVLRIKVNAVCSGKEQEYNFILKTTQDNPAVNAVILRAGLFTKEIGAYVDIVPAFIKIQEDLGIKPITPSIPKFFYGVDYTEASPGVVLVGDLNPAGFKMIDKSKGADLDHCKLAIKELAKWHALAMVLKNRNPESVRENFPYVFKEAQFGSASGSYQEKGLADGVKTMVKLVQDSSCSAEIKACAERFLEIESPFKKIQEVLKPEEPYAVICHGDSWCNNMLFRYENIDGVETPVEIKLLDLQVVRYALPTTDLSYFIFFNTSRSLRKTHLGYLLKLYHHTFTGVLQHCKFQFPEFTLEVLKDLFKKTAIFGILVGVMAVPFLLSDAERFKTMEKLRSEVSSPEEYLAKAVEIKRKESEQEKIHGPSERTKKIVQAYVGLLEDAIELSVI